MGRLIINCDLGENEPLQLTEQLLQSVDAANIGCGVHAGSLHKTRRVIELAQEHNCMIGAHPGLAGAGGRGCERPSVEDFTALLQKQLFTFLEMTESAEVSLDYVKLHGSLYHLVETDDSYAQAYLDCIQLLMPVPPAIFTLAMGRVFALSQSYGIRAYAEVFVDRAYTSRGQLLSRSEAGAVLSEKAALERLVYWLESGRMPVVEGGVIELSGDTLCLHGDTDDSLKILKKVRELVD